MWREFISIATAGGILLAGGKFAWDIATSSFTASDKPSTATPSLCHDAFGEDYVTSPCHTPGTVLTKTPEPPGHVPSELAKNGTAFIVYERVEPQAIAMR